MMAHHNSGNEMTDTQHQAAGLSEEQIDSFVPGAAVQDSFSLPQVRYAIRAALEQHQAAGPSDEQCDAIMREVQRLRTFFDVHESRAAIRAALAATHKPLTNQCGEVCERAQLCAACARGLEGTHKPVALTDADRDTVRACLTWCAHETERIAQGKDKASKTELMAQAKNQRRIAAALSAPVEAGAD